MKKMFLAFTALFFLSTFNTFAQEVRGVETKLVKYEGQKYELFKGTYTQWFGYSFFNMNSITVSVDAELYVGGKKVMEKSFVLNSKEEYILKYFGNNSFRVYNGYSGSWETYDWEKQGVGYTDGSGSRYFYPVDTYVTYKAFKLQ